jgi:hypothetical protein
MADPDGAVRFPTTYCYITDYSDALRARIGSDPPSVPRARRCGMPSPTTTARIARGGARTCDPRRGARASVTAVTSAKRLANSSFMCPCAIRIRLGVVLPREKD